MRGAMWTEYGIPDRGSEEANEASDNTDEANNSFTDRKAHFIVVAQAVLDEVKQ